MKNNFKNLFFQYWHWLIFFILVSIVLSFLIIQPGIWAFADSGFYYRDLLQAKKIALSKLGQFANTDGFYFGFDNSATAFSHLVISWYQVILTFLLGSYLGQVLYYFIYYFLCFCFGLKLLKKLFPNFRPLAIRLGALFLTFNPFSLLIFTLFTISYIYPSFVIFLYVLLNYLERGKIKYLTTSAFFAVYLLSYFRLIPIIALTLIFIFWLFYDRKYFNFRRWSIFIIVFILVASPFIVSNLQSFFSSGNIVINYQSAFSKYEEANYNFKSSFINSFSHPGGFSPSALSFTYNNRGLPGFSDNFAINDSFEFYKVWQIIFNIGVLILAFLFFPSKKNLKIISLICFIFFLNTLGFFTTLDIFSKTTRSILVFLYNDYGFVQFIQSFLYTFLLVSLFNDLKCGPKFKKKQLAFASLLIIYLLVNLLPFLSNHYGFEKVDNIPKNYQELFFANQENEFNETAIFAPYHWLNFEWSPYYLNLNSIAYSKYKSLIIPNLRLINRDFVKFYNQIFDSFASSNLENLSLFNIKNLFLFHDVKDANKNIDTYGVENLENNSARIYQQLSKRNDLNIQESNQNFTFYRFKEADDYDFFIYSPKNLLDVSLENFYHNQLIIEGKPVILDKTELNAVNLISESNFQINSPSVSVKVASDNPNKYYLKLSVNKDYPFLLQFNQMFSNSWLVYFVNKEEWEKIHCLTNWQEFEITANRKCLYPGSALQFSDLALINKKYLRPENHFVGNFIGNAFLITPQDIPAEYRAGDELYLVIYFRNQFYYLITLTLSSSVFLALIILSIWQAGKNRKLNKLCQLKIKN